ncbi:hypothetical protein QWY28_17455 [Nocardioides sp. SOB77]|uniref:Uncharacterized protein n=1 Tax=Nocardioides oceani TaxID=3058369 RepID=A0ABT8FK57_9ACTN|nr:hypothetical protein [Nocardioides oceani]MDN4174752.1 hypothetical protein [Nocardioides oceani]
MTMPQRLAAALAVLLLAGAIAATFLPTFPQGATCGTWLSPEWKSDQSDELVDDFLELGAVGDAASVRLRQRLCDDALGTRRTVSLVLLGAAVLVPGAVLLVAGGRRRDEVRGEPA